MPAKLFSLQAIQLPWAVFIFRGLSMKSMHLPMAIGLGWLLLSGSALAEQSVFAFAEIGMSPLHESNMPVSDDSGADVSTDIDDDIWQGRIAVQKPWHKGVGELGWEGGAGLGWTSPDVAYLVRSNGGTTANVAIKTDLVIFQTFLGLYGGLNLGSRVRLSASAGPAFVFGSQASDPVEKTIIINGQPTTVEVGGKDTDATVVGYAHANLHIRASDDIWIGAGVGIMSGELDFTDTIGALPLNQAAYSLSISVPMDM